MSKADLKTASPPIMTIHSLSHTNMLMHSPTQPPTHSLTHLLTPGVVSSNLPLGVAVSIDTAVPHTPARHAVSLVIRFPAPETGTNNTQCKTIQYHVTPGALLSQKLVTCDQQ